jgi:hypothetical protein
MARQGIDDYILSSIPHLLQDLDYLSEFEVDIPRQGLAISIRKYLPLFAKMEQLKIGGNWYSGVETLETMSIEVIPWKLQRLAIDRINMSFLPFCPQLEQLTFSHSLSRVENFQRLKVKKGIVVQLQGLSRLNKTPSMFAICTLAGEDIQTRRL